MNKNLFLGLAAAAFLGAYSLSMAQNDNAADNSEVAVMTVSQIGNIEEDATVTLRGNLTQNLGNDTYVFTDSTGNINAVIEAGDWNGTTFNPDTVVFVTGQVNKNGDITELDVTEIQSAQ
ncbi:MAG: NirD/YgiW/YdeI family stress tolerance protein [Alphaproteobacteria bacterium]|nr:NirD/YgiW/YdeI family stress tolerance protein [Alphaproteobacteria bacterium]